MAISNRVGIACESGGFRCVFVHGALAALEEHGVRAEAYAAASASVMPAAFAAAGRARDPGMAYWRDAIAVRMAENNGMSEMVLAGIEHYAPLVETDLFDPSSPRFLIAASEVVDRNVAEATQGPLASRTGREQLLKMARGDDSWARASLRAVIFDSRSHDDPLNRSNFRAAAYASTRMLHAWRVPASVDGRPFIDASYTDGFPVRALLALGLEHVLAIATGCDAAYVNLYRTHALVDDAVTTPVDVLRPDIDLATLGVDFTTATEDGLQRAYDHGRDVATRWLRKATMAGGVRGV